MTTPDVGQTIRFPSSALMTVDSEDRWKDYPESITDFNNPAYRDPFNFQVQNNGFLSTGFFTRLAVTEVVMPWCPNINPKTNRINIQYVNGGVLSPIVQISLGVQGFLTPHQIATALQTAVRANNPGVLGGFQIQYGLNNFPQFSYDLSGGGGTATAISFAPLIEGTAGYSYSPLTKQLFQVLGFNEQNIIPAAANNGFNTYCQSVRYVDIVANDLTKFQGVSDTSTQPLARESLCRVYLGGFVSPLSPSDPDFAPIGTTPSIIYRNFTNPKQIQWIAKQNINANLTFQVYDDAGDLFSTDSPFGVYTTDNWSMTMLVSEN